MARGASSYRNLGMIARTVMDNSVVLSAAGQTATGEDVKFSKAWFT